MMQLPKTVLVTDDDTAVLKIATTRLEAEGVRVLTANNGAEGLRLANEHVPDVIVLDLMMPGMHGYTVIQEIRNHASLNHVRILVSSAKTYTSDIERARRLGADRYLSKPYEQVMALLSFEKFAEAQPLARECLALREKLIPDEWVTFNARSMLGG